MESIALVVSWILFALICGSTVAVHLGGLRQWIRVADPVVRYVVVPAEASLPAVELPAPQAGSSPTVSEASPPEAAASVGSDELTADQQQAIRELVAIGAKRTQIVRLLRGNTQRRYQQLKAVLDEPEAR